MVETPYLEIDLRKIQHNAHTALKIWNKYTIDVMAITKVCSGEPRIVTALLDAGIKMLGDSRIKNIIRMKKANIDATFVLIRTPFLSDVKRVVTHANISLNTEMEVINALANEAKKQNKKHKIILMIEMGDRREGVMPEDIEKDVGTILKLNHIELVGIGANFACFGGTKPNQAKMDHLSRLAKMIEDRFDIKLSIISGGNSANYSWLDNHISIGKINNIRLGESIFLGVETLYRKPLDAFFQDSFTLVGEVIELKIKPSLPNGEIAFNAFGEMPYFKDKGLMRRALVGIGREDVDINGLTPRIDIDILGGSSDHIVLDAKEEKLKVGNRIEFDLNYSALLSAMTSSSVNKVFKE